MRKVSIHGIRALLYNLVDITWGYAKEDSSVPGTLEATEIIKQALKATKLGKRGINLKIEEKRAKK